MVTLSGFKEYANFPGSAKGVLTNELGIPTDSVIQSQLNSSMSIVRDLLALPAADPLPDNSRIDTSVYLLTQFLIENRSTQERVSAINIDDDIKEQKTSYYRSQLKTAIFKQVEGLLHKDKNVLAFMPEAPA